MRDQDKQWNPLEPLGVTWREARALRDEILRDYPMLVMGRADLDEGTFGVNLHYGDDEFITLRHSSQWNEPNPLLKRLIGKAMKYAFVCQGLSNDEAKQETKQAMIPLEQAWARQRGLIYRIEEVSC